MAQLDPKHYPLTYQHGAADFRACMAEEDDELRHLAELATHFPKEQLQGRVISFHVGDGKAYYFVKREKPLILQHMDFFDGYQIDAATIRGLRLEEVRRMVIWERVFAKIAARTRQHATVG